MQRRRHLLLFGIKLAISGALVAWILRRADLGKIFHEIGSADLRFVIAAFLLVFVGYFFTATRWRALLSAQGIDAPRRVLIGSHMVAAFVGNFLPSAIGGDVVRVYDSWRLGGSKSRALVVIAADRFLGVLALVLYALTASIFCGSLAASIPHLRAWILVGSGAAAAGLLTVLCAPPSVYRWISRLAGVLPAVAQAPVRNVLTALEAFRGRHDVLVTALLASLVLQLNVVVTQYALATALSLDVPFLHFFAISPLATIAMMLPISINAIGVRESVFAFFFSLYGVSSEVAIGFAWLLYSLHLGHGVLGGLVFAARRRRHAAAQVAPIPPGTTDSPDPPSQVSTGRL